MDDSEIEETVKNSNWPSVSGSYGKRKIDLPTVRLKNHHFIIGQFGFNVLFSILNNRKKRNCWIFAVGRRWAEANWLDSVNWPRIKTWTSIVSPSVLVARLYCCCVGITRAIASTFASERYWIGKTSIWASWLRKWVTMPSPYCADTIQTPTCLIASVFFSNGA